MEIARMSHNLTSVIMLHSEHYLCNIVYPLSSIRECDWLYSPRSHPRTLHKDKDSFRHLAYFFSKQTKVLLYSEINNYIFLIDHDLHKLWQKYQELYLHCFLNHQNDYSTIDCYYVYARIVSALIDIIHIIAELTMPIIIPFHGGQFHGRH